MELDERVQEDPFLQFGIWFDEASKAAKNTHPDAMVLATVDENNFPNTRIVLLKEYDKGQFIFYSNYESKKAKEIEKNNSVALNFYWPELGRQVRIRGFVEKITREKSENYFATRPREAQLAACVSPQSSVITNRDEIDKKIALLSKKFANKSIACPSHWGGYVVIPFEYEFFQERQWRTHDRFLYTLQDNVWKRVRLAP